MIPALIVIVILAAVSGWYFYDFKAHKSKREHLRENEGQNHSETAALPLAPNEVSKENATVSPIQKTTATIDSSSLRLNVRVNSQHRQKKVPQQKRFRAPESKIPRPELNRSLRKMSFIRKKPMQLMNCAVCSGPLHPEAVYLASYPTAHFKESGTVNYLSADVLTCSKCRYVCADEQTIAAIKVKANAYWIDIKPWEDAVKQPKSDKKQAAPADQKPFKWPSTYAVETLKPVNSLNEFRQESDLHKLGYQISGNVSRAKRWRILEQEALPKLGLEKVANTIASNVRQRKRQRGGAVKYAYAIKEWEHDLSELKKHYYKWDFIWPHTS